jgi:Zn-dependent protease with chaperone function
VDPRAALLLELYLLVTVIAPMILARTSWISRRPALVLAAWHTSLLTAMISLILALGILIADGVETQVAPHIVADEHNWFDPITSTILAWGATAVLGVLIFRMVTESRRIVGEQRTRGEYLSHLLAASRPAAACGMPIRLVETQAPLAAALPSARAMLVSVGTRKFLDDDHLRAVLEHESAHLRLHHATAVTAARISQSVIPTLPATARLSQATSIVVELIADDAAARRCGRDRVADALRLFAPDDAGTQLRSDRLLSQRTPDIAFDRIGTALCYLLPLLPILIATHP